jgi:hypothetical protein
MNNEMKMLMEGWRRFLNEGEEATAPKKNVSYTGVVLYEDESSKLQSLVPEGWKSVCHHMTLHMGPVKNEDERPLLGSEYTLVVEGFAQNDKVCAVKVKLPDELSSYYKGKGIAHITIATGEGGKPVMSNDLDWSSLKGVPISSVKGKLIEVEQGDNSFATHGVNEEAELRLPKGPNSASLDEEDLEEGHQDPDEPNPNREGDGDEGIRWDTP